MDRADDQRLADALRRGDADAPATLYDAYGERLYAYAFMLLGERETAADAVHDALVTAQGCVRRLKEGARLRAWLYALTRFQAVARMAHRGGTPPEGLPAPVLEDSGDAELSELVRETLGELSRNERELLELSPRHGLTPAEAGAVLGLTSRQSASRLGRARDHLENAAAAVILARVGRAHCPDLSSMVDSWEGPLTPLLRRRLSGHIGGCEVCTEGRHRKVSAGRLLDMVPVAYPPISLRHRVIETCGSPDGDETRMLIMDRGDGLDRSGFPAMAEPRSRRRRPRGLAPVVLAGACVLAATGAMVMISGGETGTGTALHVIPSPPASSPEEGLTGPAEEPEPEAEDEPTPGPTPTPSVADSGRVPPTVRPVATMATTRPATAPPATRRAVPGARLSATCPNGIDGAATVRLTARNAALSWSASASQGLGVFPASGSIKAGGSASIWVTVTDPNTPGSGTVSFSSNGGGGTCSLSWHGQPRQHSEAPSEDPTPTPDVTDPVSDPSQSASADGVHIETANPS
ncbi:sigma-70 family RNA polymerase sigma factor [Nonomuraea sp. NPDC048916]|uniref:RNA polymerase sigma factor n=1 Tax=Nonomuraea sp. NPDC048916 TaxID=3154232 RepID=UPI00340F5BB2